MGGVDRAGAGAVTPGRLLVVGELNVDLIVLLTGELRFGQHEQFVSGTTLTMGSSSAITACGAARLGVPTSLVAVRGDDVFGRFLDDELRERGVDVSACRIDPVVPTGSGVHLSRPDGDRAILTHMGSIGRVRASDVPDGLLAASTALHTGSYFLQEELWGDAPGLFGRARSLGLSVSLDGNFDPREQWDSGILDALAHVDVFFANEQEACGIAKAAEPEAAVQRLLSAMPEGAVIVLKRGADGASAYRGTGEDRESWSVGAPSLTGRLVDTVGAGDSLAAGFLAARLNGMEIPDALRIAAACGTASTRAAGGIDGQIDLAAARELASAI